jgi:hypothetical protein
MNMNHLAVIPAYAGIHPSTVPNPGVCRHESWAADQLRDCAGKELT